MDKSFLVAYIRYHQWANAALMSVVKTLSAEELHRPIPGSFLGVYATLLHLWWAESRWWQRMSHDPVPDDADPFDKDVLMLSDALFEVSERWKERLLSMNEEELQEDLTYRNSMGEFHHPINEIVFTCFSTAPIIVDNWSRCCVNWVDRRFHRQTTSSGSA